MAPGSSQRNRKSLSARLVAGLLERAGAPPVRVKLPSGQTAGCPQQEAIASIHVRSRRVLWKLLVNPDLEFGRAYARGEIDVEGSLADLLTAAYARAPRSTSWRLRLGQALGLYHRAIGAERARRNARHHYEVGDDFYRSWLDPTLTYSCAYFARREAGLEEAQRAKLELVCRKLDLRPGQTVVEAGSGWGSLALYMAQHYGVRVRAYNTSGQQVAYARSLARRLGLDDRVEFIEDDYRSIRGHYDAFVSVGMLEHVGRRHYRQLGRIVANCLGRSGRGLIHAIGRAAPRPMNPWVRRYIFPDGHAPALSEILDVLEPNGLCVWDVENLRPHYARTLEVWLERFERSAARFEQQFGQQFVRTWRLYLAGALASFRTGWLELYQVVFLPAGAKLPRQRPAPL